MVCTCNTCRCKLSTVLYDLVYSSARPDTSPSTVLFLASAYMQTVVGGLWKLTMLRDKSQLLILRYFV
jgi:hypothetical protein